MEKFITFDERKKYIIQGIYSLAKNLQPSDRVYIVCNVYGKFSIWILNDGTPDIINIFKDRLGNYVTIVDLISKDSLALKDLQGKAEKLLDTEQIFYSDRHIDKLNWYLKDKKFSISTPIICFYSFKGGLGRTTALSTASVALARKGLRVALLDFDLEAPGLSSLFRDNLAENLEPSGIVDYLLDTSSQDTTNNSINLSNYYFTVNRQDVVGDQGGELFIFPAMYEGDNLPNESSATNEQYYTNYIDKLSKINLLFQDETRFLPDLLLKQIEKDIAPDVIIIDTRTGVNEIAGLFLSRYADMSFLFFYGNRQNMIGLNTILEQLGKLNVDSKLYLVNSPVPKDSTIGDEEREYFLQKAYDIFSDIYYPEDNLPFINDQTAEHYPIEVPYSDFAIRPENVENQNALLSIKGNPYEKIASTIETILGNGVNRQTNKIVQLGTSSDNKELLEAFKSIAPEGTAASEYEFDTVEKLRKWFYPRKDYRFIFDRSKFLVLGEKGAGKTALFAVLSNRDYAYAIAEFIGTHKHPGTREELEKTLWIKGLDNTQDFPSNAVFEQLAECNSIEIKLFWLLLLIRYIPKEILPSDNTFDEVVSLSQKNYSVIIDALKNHRWSLVAEELLDNINNKLKEKGDCYIYIYDYLDRLLSDNENLRGKLISGLLELWFGFVNRMSNIRSKIFLRKDIFEREVSFTDKIKVNNHSVEITWQYDQLLNVVWKRVLHSGHILPKEFTKDFASNSNSGQIDSLGQIPEFGETENRKILTYLLGEFMGGNNKAFPYNWIIYHVSDAHRRIQPRSIINLFSKTGAKQLESNERSDTPIKPKFMEFVMPEVSNQRVQDIKEEYPQLKVVFEGLHTHLQKFPAEEGVLDNAIQLIITENVKMKLTNDEIKRKLIEVGVLYEYKFTKKENEKRYHIPDLYLFGLGLKRKGPGAHKVLFNKK